MDQYINYDFKEKKTGCSFMLISRRQYLCNIEDFGNPYMTCGYLDGAVLNRDNSDGVGGTYCSQILFHT